MLPGHSSPRCSWSSWENRVKRCLKVGIKLRLIWRCSKVGSAICSKHIPRSSSPSSRSLPQTAQNLGPKSVLKKIGRGGTFTMRRRKRKNSHDKNCEKLWEVARNCENQNGLSDIKVWSQGDKWGCDQSVGSDESDDYLSVRLIYLSVYGSTHQSICVIYLSTWFLWFLPFLPFLPVMYPLRVIYEATMHRTSHLSLSMCLFCYLSI